MRANWPNTSVNNKSIMLIIVSSNYVDDIKRYVQMTDQLTYLVSLYEMTSLPISTAV